MQTAAWSEEEGEHLGAHGRPIDPLLWVRLAGLLAHPVHAQVCQLGDGCLKTVCPLCGIKIWRFDILRLQCSSQGKDNLILLAKATLSSSVKYWQRYIDMHCFEANDVP